MNSPQSITVSLDWARKLKDAGWPQRTSHFIFIHHDADTKLWSRWNTAEPRGGYTDGSMEWAAPTAEEILQRLPEAAHGIIQADMLIRRIHGAWQIAYSRLQETGVNLSLANAAAAMYCHLASQKLLPPV